MKFSTSGLKSAFSLGNLGQHVLISVLTSGPYALGNGTDWKGALAFFGVVFVALTVDEFLRFDR